MDVLKFGFARFRCMNEYWYRWVYFLFLQEGALQVGLGHVLLHQIPNCAAPRTAPFKPSWGGDYGHVIFRPPSLSRLHTQMKIAFWCDEIPLTFAVGRLNQSCRYVIASLTNLLLCRGSTFYHPCQILTWCHAHESLRRRTFLNLAEVFLMSSVESQSLHWHGFR